MKYSLIAVILVVLLIASMAYPAFLIDKYQQRYFYHLGFVIAKNVYFLASMYSSACFSSLCIVVESGI